MSRASGIRAGRAFVEIGADRSQLERELKAAQSQLRSFGSQVASIGAKVAAVGVALSAPFVASARTFAGFEASMSRVAALSGATGEDLAALSEEAQRLGSTTAFSASQAADALSFFALAGFSVGDMLRAVGPTLDLAAAGQLDLATAADITAKIISGMGLDVTETAGAVDILTKAMTTANTDLQQLGDAMKFIGPIAKSAGLEFEEVVAAVQLLSNAGIQGEQAGTTLRGALLALTSPSREAGELLAQLGVRVADAAGDVRPLADILQDIQTATDALGSGQRLEILGTLFGARPAGGIAELLSQGADTLREFTGELRNAGGTAERIAGQQLDNLIGDVTVLKSSLEGLGIAVGQSLVSPLRVLAQRASDVASAIGAWAGENRAAVLTVAATVAGVTALGVGLVGVGLAAAGAGIAAGGLATIVAGIGTAAGIAAAAVGVAAVGFIGLGGVIATQTDIGRSAIELLRTQFGFLARDAVEAWGTITQAVQQGNIGAAIGAALSSVAASFFELRAVITDSFFGLLTDLLRGLVRFADQVQQTIASIVSSAVQGIAGLGAGTLDTLGLGSLANAVRSGGGFVSGVAGGLSGAASAGSSVLQGQIDSLEQFGREVAEGNRRSAESFRGIRQGIEQGLQLQPGGSSDASAAAVGGGAGIAAAAAAAGLGEQSRVSSSGLFNIAGLRGLGQTRPVEERTAKAAETTAREVTKLAQNALAGGLTFN